MEVIFHILILAISGLTMKSVFQFGPTRKTSQVFNEIFDFSRDSGVDNLFLSNRWSTNQAEWTIFRNRTQRSLTVQDFWELDKWQHVVATIDQNGVMKLFSDGQLRGSILGHLPRSTVRTSQLLGKSNDGDHAYFKGMMDDLRLYGRALPRGSGTYIQW